MQWERTRPALKLVGLTLVVATFGCSDVEPLVAPLALAPTPVMVTRIAGDGFVREEGSVDGGLYAIIRPEDWNGDLVVMLHGSVPAQAPLSLQPLLHWWWSPFIDALVDRGFGVAFSSYRVNGVAWRQGAIDSRIAEAQFVARFGRPRDTYLVGWSMGSTIGQHLLETSPSRYAGLLAVCGALSGPTRQNALFVDMRILFDYFFPGVLPGNVLTSDFDYLEEGLPKVVAAVTGDIPNAIAMASVDQLYRQWDTPAKLVTGIAAGLFIAGGGTRDLQEKTGGVPFDNTATVYTSPILSAEELSALNDGVMRIEGDPNALRYLQQLDPDGGFGPARMLSLTTSFDPLLPSRSTDPRSRHWCRRRERRTSSCFGSSTVSGIVEFGFDGAPDPFIDLEITAFDDLVAWIRDGVKPVP